MFPKEVISIAQYLLSVSEDEQRVYWEKHVAVDYWHGRYLSIATDRSKNWTFKRWLKTIRKIAVAEES